MMISLKPFRQGAMLLAGLTFAAFAQAQYTFTTFSLPGADGMQGWALNNALRVPGNAYGTSAPPDSLIYDHTAGTLTSIPSAGGGLRSTAIGINNAGQLAGSYTDGSGVKGYVLTGSTYNTFHFPGSIKTYGRALNNTGLVTGYGEMTTTPFTSSGFIYEPATGIFTAIAPAGASFTIAQGVNDAGVVVGSSTMFPGAVYPGSPAGPYGWVRQPGGTLTFFRVNSQPTRARGINNAGEIVGWFSDVPGTFVKSFKVTVSGAAYEDITVPAADVIAMAGAEQTITEGINDAGYISGSVYYPDGTSDGFIAAPPAMTSLAGLYTMIEGFSLPKGIANSFLVKVKAAMQSLDDGDIKAACGNLKALISHAEAQSGKKLTESQANRIIAVAQAIRLTLGC
jgi:hypothetical protein